MWVYSSEKISERKEMVLHFSSDMQKTGLTEKQRLSLHCFHITWFLSWKTISGGLVQNKSIKRRVCVRREWNPPVRFIPLCEVCCSHAALKCNPCPITALSLTRGRGWKQRRWSEASKCLFLRFTDSYRVVVFFIAPALNASSWKWFGIIIETWSKCSYE